MIFSNAVSSAASAGPKAGVSSALTRMSNPPSCLAARSAVADTSARIAALCTRIDGLGAGRSHQFGGFLELLVGAGLLRGEHDFGAGLGEGDGGGAADGMLGADDERAFAFEREIIRRVGGGHFSSARSLFSLVRILRRDSGRRDSARQSAAVDRDQLAVDVIGRVGGEEHRERAEFAVLADAAHRE